MFIGKKRMVEEEEKEKIKEEVVNLRISCVGFFFLFSNIFFLF